MRRLFMNVLHPYFDIFCLTERVLAAVSVIVVLPALVTAKIQMLWCHNNFHTCERSIYMYKKDNLMTVRNQANVILSVHSLIDRVTLQSFSLCSHVHVKLPAQHTAIQFIHDPMHFRSLWTISLLRSLKNHFSNRNC